MFEIWEERRGPLLGLLLVDLYLKYGPDLHGIRETEGPVQNFHADSGRESSRDH